MPSGAGRPKQRQLIRWNDDLDKSLLLFITHTCAEMGIKIPFDEVARRMGSHFTEGAIQQHIAKLRSKMSVLQVAPVPNAPKRGQVTSRPSSIYTQKSRTSALPAPPLASKARGRKTTRAAQGDESQAGRPAAKPRAQRNARQIKRSSSDPGESEDEFPGEDDDDYNPDQVNSNGKRVRRAQGQAAMERRDSARTVQIMQALADADARFDSRNDTDQDVEWPQNEFSLYNNSSVQGSFGHNQGAVFPGAGAQSNLGNYGRFDGPSTHDEDEEEEEEDLPVMARNAVNDHITGQVNGTREQFMPGYDDQVSPTSITHMAQSGPVRPMSLPQSHGQGHGVFQFSGSNPFDSDNVAGPGLSGYSACPGTAINAAHMNMVPSAMAPAVLPSMPPPPPADSHGPSRNHSMLSQSSSRMGSSPLTPVAQHTDFDCTSGIFKQPHNSTFETTLPMMAGEDIFDFGKYQAGNGTANEFPDFQDAFGGSGFGEFLDPGL